MTIQGNIPLDRPVVGQDLDTLRRTLGLSTQDACYLFGISITKWMMIVRKRATEPVKANMAIMVRLIDAHPEMAAIFRFPSPKDVMELIRQYQPMDPKRFSILTGNDSSAYYRWDKMGSRQNPVMSRLALYLFMMLERQETIPGGKKFIEDWTQMAVAEATARGRSDVLSKGCWSDPGKPVKPRAPKKKAA